MMARPSYRQWWGGRTRVRRQVQRRPVDVCAVPESVRSGPKATRSATTARERYCSDRLGGLLRRPEKEPAVAGGAVPQVLGTEPPYLNSALLKHSARGAQWLIRGLGSDHRHYGVTDSWAHDAWRGQFGWSGPVTDQPPERRRSLNDGSKPDRDQMQRAGLSSYVQGCHRPLRIQEPPTGDDSSPSARPELDGRSWRGSLPSSFPPRDAGERVQTP